MGMLSIIKNVFARMFDTEAKAYFGAEPVSSTDMQSAITAWMATYRGAPAWVDSADEIRTINFAKSVCAETARLSTLAIGINAEGSARASWLQRQIEIMILPRLRRWIEYGCAAGTLILKPNGSGIDVVTPERFMVTACDSNKRITGAIFQDTYTVGKEYYTKLEYHRIEGSQYRISSKAFVSNSEGVLGRPVGLEATRWADINPEVAITKQSGDGIERMLFGVFTMPEANSIDLDSPLGMSIFSGAMEELRDLDIAYSRNATEIEDSSTIELLDDLLIRGDGKKASRLPRHVHNVFGNDAGDFYQQIVRPLSTTERKVGINQQLSLIGYKCGYSNGYFVFDQKTGMATATQVESDDRRTIQLIKDVRDQLQSALDDTIYAMSIFADLYDLAPAGAYEISYDFGDITYNTDEDRNRSYQLMIQGVVPKWWYLSKWEGMSEEEAKALVAETQASSRRQQLFEEATTE